MKRPIVYRGCHRPRLMHRPVAMVLSLVAVAVGVVLLTVGLAGLGATTAQPVHVPTVHVQVWILHPAGQRSV